MLDSNYLQKRAQELDLGRGDSLSAIQAVLDALYPGQTRAININEQTLKIITPSAPVASELRLRQVELIKSFNQTANCSITKLHIQIRDL